MAGGARERRLWSIHEGSVMNGKRATPVLALLALAGVLAAVAPAASSHASLLIRHQVRGCHSWSLNGGAYSASHTIVLSRGGSVTVTNNDVMPHQLVKTGGPAVRYTRLSAGTNGVMALKGTFPPAMLARMGAADRITFTKAGVYHFTTKAGEDYMKGIKTIGEDNVLRLTVRVS
jgi:plastocyanin